MLEIKFRISCSLKVYMCIADSRVCKRVLCAKFVLKFFPRKAARNWPSDRYILSEKGIVSSKTLFDQHSKMFGEKSGTGR